MKFLTERARNLNCYDGGHQLLDEKMIPLHYNELQYAPSPKVAKVMEYFAQNPLRLRRYYDSNAIDLCKAAAGKLGLSPKQIRADNGSDAVLSIIFGAFLAGKRVGIPDLTYSFYRVWVGFYGVDAKYVPLKEDFSIDLNDYKGLDAILLPNPNAPTGVALRVEQIEEFVKNNPDTLVVIDEAYVDFSDVGSCACLIKKYDNLLVTQTMSKAYGLANLRVGFVAGNEELIEVFRKMQGCTVQFPLSEVSQKAATAALTDRAYYSGVIERVKGTRARVTKQLRELGLGVVDSQTNFLFVECDGAKELFEYLKENQILVRHWSSSGIEKFLRVTVGTDEQMEVFLSCVRAFLSERH